MSANLKTYQAFSMAEALTAVKRDLGRDAVILHTRNFRKGGFLGFGGRQMWEITASRHVNVAPRRKSSSPVSRTNHAKLDPPKHATDRLGGVAVINGPSRLATAVATESTVGNVEVPDAKLSMQLQALTGVVEKLVQQHNPEKTAEVPDELFEMYLNLIQHEVAEDIAKELVEKVRAQLTGDQLGDKALVRKRLREFIAGMIPTSQSEFSPTQGRPRVIALIGPTGVGKTTTIAKLAANLKLRQNLRVGLITIDTYRIAAVEQLRTYAQIISVPLKVVLSPAELTAAIDSMGDCDAVLVDTAGRSQNNADRLVELKGFLEAASADEVHLVLSTTANQRNVAAAVERFSALGVDRLILTKLDEAVSFGMVLGIVRQMDAALSFVTVGQDVPDDIEAGEGRRIAELIVGGDG